MYNGSNTTVGVTKIYVDGMLKGTGENVYVNSTSWADDEDVFIGVFDDSDFYSHWNGSIDEVKIWNRSLSATEIKALYEQRAKAHEPYAHRGQDNTFYGNLSIELKKNSKGLNINSEATTLSNYGLSIETGQGADAFKASSDGTVATYLARDLDGFSNWFYRNDPSSSTNGVLVKIEQDAATDDQTVLEVQNDGTGYGAYIDQNGDGIGLYIEQTGDNLGGYIKTTNDHAALQLDNDIGGVGTRIIHLGIDNAIGDSRFYRNLASTDTLGSVVNIVQDNAGDDQSALSIQQDGNKDALFINQNGVPGYGAIWIENRDNENSRGLFIHNSNGYSSSQYPAIRLTNWDGNYGSTDLWQGTNNTWGTNYFRRNVNSTYTNEAIIYGHQDNLNDNQPVITTRQDSSSAPFMRLIQNGHACNLIVDSDGTCDAGTAMVVDNGIAICAVCS